jgi:hypothetical protein
VRAVPSDAVGGHEQAGDDAERPEGEERGGEGDLLDGRAARAPDGAADEVVVVGDGESVVDVRHGNETLERGGCKERKKGSGPCDGSSPTARMRARGARKEKTRQGRRVDTDGVVIMIVNGMV